MSDKATIDKLQVRRAFSRHRGGGDLYAEVAARLAARLDEVEVTPTWIIDVGGDGEVMRQRFPQAQVAAMDFAQARLGGGGLRLLADAENLPFADASVDMVWSNLCYDWTDFSAVLREAARVLRRQSGALIFSMLGRDTLYEARSVFAEGDRIHTFMDMHDIGDMLAAGGFTEPVLETEHVALTYQNAEDALREPHLAGAGNALVTRRRGLLGRVRWQQAVADYQRKFAAADGRVPATFELIYVLCWRRQDAPSEQIVRFSKNESMG